VVIGSDLLRRADQIQAQTGLERWPSLMRVLLAELKALRLPDEIRPILSLAIRYWTEEKGSVGDLARAKESCWMFIESLGGRAGLDLVEGRKARALLCVLEPTGDDEARSMTADWFADMLRELR
jgi:hypothetical protein